MEEPKDEISILQFSDTHISERPEFNPNAYELAVDMINRSEADYYIHTGDVTQEGTREDYTLARRLLSRIEKDVIYIIGNHDARNVGYELFDEFVGPTQPLYVDDRVLIAGFDTTIPDRNDGRFGAKSLQEMRKLLREKGRGRTKILAFHHHLIPVPRAGRERSMIVDAGDVLECVLSYGVDLVLNGHRHSPNMFRVEDTVIVNSGTVSSHKTRAGDYHNFNSIRISPGESVDVKVLNVESRTLGEFARPVKKASRLAGASGDRIARIVQISDTHFSNLPDFLGEAYEMSVNRINQLKPDLVVHCGDLTHDGLTDSYDIATERLAEISFPKIILPGPRDLLHLGHLLFRERIGELDPVFHGGDFHVYAINSSQFDEEDGRIGRTQIRELTDRISGAGDHSIKIVALHHHVLPLPHTREKFPIEDCGDVLANLLENRVDMVLTGHRHIAHAYRIDDTVVVNANTLSSRRYQARYGNTFNLIDILSDGTALISEIGSLSGSRRILGIYKLCSPLAPG